MPSPPIYCKTRTLDTMSTKDRQHKRKRNVDTSDNEDSGSRNEARDEREFTQVQLQATLDKLLERMNAALEGLKIEVRSPLLGVKRASAIESFVAGFESILSQTSPRSDEQKHAKTWGVIFKDLAWLNKLTSTGKNPAILGNTVEVFYNDGEMLELSTWVLLTGSSSGKSFKKDLFLRCLQPYTRYDKPYEIHFDSGLILNVFDVMRNTDKGIKIKPITIRPTEGTTHISNLFLFSDYVYWAKNPQVHTVSDERFQHMNLYYGRTTACVVRIKCFYLVTIEDNGKLEKYLFARCFDVTEGYGQFRGLEESDSQRTKESDTRDNEALTSDSESEQRQSKMPRSDMEDREALTSASEESNSENHEAMTSDSVSGQRQSKKLSLGGDDREALTSASEKSSSCGRLGE